MTYVLHSEKVNAVKRQFPGAILRIDCDMPEKQYKTYRTAYRRLPDSAKRDLGYVYGEGHIVALLPDGRFIVQYGANDGEYRVIHTPEPVREAEPVSEPEHHATERAQYAEDAKWYNEPYRLWGFYVAPKWHEAGTYDHIDGYEDVPIDKIPPGEHAFYVSKVVGHDRASLEVKQYINTTSTPSTTGPSVYTCYRTIEAAQRALQRMVG